MRGKQIWRRLVSFAILAMLVLADTRPGLAADSGEDLNQRAVALHGQGKYKDAVYRRALAGYERVLGPEHPETLTGVNNLAVLFQTLGRHGEAEPLLKRALTDTERAWGPDHLTTLERTNNLAMLYQAQAAGLIERVGDCAEVEKRRRVL